MHYVKEALKTAKEKRSESQLACVRDWLEQVKFQHVKMDDMRSVLPQLARQMELNGHGFFFVFDVLCPCSFLGSFAAVAGSANGVKWPRLFFRC